MNKDDLINILIDWVEEDTKVNIDTGYFIDIEDITSICGGAWIGSTIKSKYNRSKSITSDTWMETDKYIKINKSIIKNGWDKSYSPCILKFLKPKTKNEKGWISDIIVKDGNHRIAMMNKNNIKNKIYTKFIFESSTDTRLGNTHRKKIKYEIK